MQIAKIIEPAGVNVTEVQSAPHVPVVQNMIGCMVSVLKSY